MHERITDDSNNSAAFQFGDIEKDSIVYSIGYTFEIDEGHYGVYSGLVIPPDKKKSVDTTEEIEKIKNELLEIVKQIIDKGEDLS